MKQIDLGDLVYHIDVSNGNELLKVVGLKEGKVLLAGDYAGGTHNVVQKDWLSREGVLTKTEPEVIIGRPLITKDSLMTVSGKYIDVTNLDIDKIDIEDIASALSNQCRFGGHTKEFYSVAQHCCGCAVLAPNRLQLTALLHDASEGYLVDVPKPLKRHLPNYIRIEDEFMKKIALKFNIVYPFPDEIHAVDVGMMELEWNRFTVGDKVESVYDKYSSVLVGTAWSPDLAKQTFLNMYKKLVQNENK